MPLTSPQITLCCELLHRRRYSGASRPYPPRFAGTPPAMRRRAVHPTAALRRSGGWRRCDKFSWLGGAGMRGCRAGRLPCSNSAARPAPAAPAGAGHSAGWPASPAGRPGAARAPALVARARPTPVTRSIRLGTRPFGFGAASLAAGRNGGLGQRDRARRPGIGRFWRDEGAVPYCRSLSRLRRLRQRFAVELRSRLWSIAPHSA